MQRILKSFSAIQGFPSCVFFGVLFNFGVRYWHQMSNYSTSTSFSKVKYIKLYFKYERF